MFIFSRSRGPWVAFVFILIIAVGALMRWQSTMDEEESMLQSECAAFVEFNTKAEALLNLTDKQRESGLLFEAFKCRKPAPGDRKYCNQVAEKLYDILSEEQREKFKPLVQEYFSK